MRVAIRVSSSAILVVNDLAEWEDILPATATMLERRYGIEHVTLQAEPRVKIMKRLPVRP